MQKWLSAKPIQMKTCRSALPAQKIWRAWEFSISHRAILFFNRRNGQGTGVIVITSSRPLTSSELNIVVKVKEGNATATAHKTTLKPSQTVPLRASVNEKPLVPVIVTEKILP